METHSKTFSGPTLEEAPLGSRPTALILTGGAAMGSWQGGFLYSLEKTHGVPFHSVVGISAGSINGAAYLQDDTEVLKTVWCDIPRGVFMRLSPRLRPPSLLSLSVVGDFLKTLIDEERCRRRRRCWFYVVSVDIRNGGTIQAEYSPDPKGPWDAPMLDYVQGSIAVPFLFPPKEMPPSNGFPPRSLVDGHVTSFTFLKPLVERGVRDFLFVSVLDLRRPRRPPFTLVRYMSALVEQMMRAQVDNSLALFRDLAQARDLRAFEFAPSEPLDIGVFTFNRKECRRSFYQGLSDADACLTDPGRHRIL
ncbi:MAG: patatin-like phospholipase family protein [Elusimicrobiota bacterium]